MTAKTAKQKITFTAAEREMIQMAAQRVWDIIGGDVLNAVAEQTGGGDIGREELIEVVLDAGRLTDELAQKRLSPDAIRRWKAADYNTRKRIVRGAFSFTRYGW